MMGDAQIERLAVVDQQGRLIGVITVGDIAVKMLRKFLPDRPSERSAKIAGWANEVIGSNRGYDLGAKVIQVDSSDFSQATDIFNDYIKVIARHDDVGAPKTPERPTDVNR